MAKSRVQRLLSILLILRNREWASAEELSSRFEVSLRTVYRDIEALQNNGVPVTGIRGPDGGYRLEAESPFKQTTLNSTLSPEHALAFMLFEATSGSAAKGSVPDLELLYRGMSPEDVESLRKHWHRFHFDTADWYWKDEGIELVPQIREALLKESAIRIFYVSRDETPARSDTIQPYGLVWKAGQWYLVGESSEFGRIVRHRLSRIMRTEDLLTHFHYPETFDLSKWWAAEMESFGKGEIRVSLIAAGTARHEIMQLARKSESQVEIHGDKLRLILYVNEWNWLIPLIMSFGSSVIVEEPTQLRAEVIATFQSAIRANNRLSPNDDHVVGVDRRSRATRGRSSSKD